MRKFLLLTIVIFVLVINAVEYDYDLKRGWNLIAIPCELETDILVDIFDYIAPAYVYNSISGGYTGIDTIPAPISGMWLLVTTDTIISIECPDCPGEEDTLYTSCNSYFCGSLDTAMAALSISSGGYMFMQSMPDTTDPGSVPELLINRLSDSGLPIWSKRYNVKSSNAIIEASDGNFLIAGRGIEDNAIFIMKIDNAGDPVWAKEAMVDFESDGDLISLFEREDSTYIANFVDKIVAFSYTGDILWSKSSEAVIYDIAPSESNGFAYITESDIAGMWVPTIAKANSSGNVLSGKVFSDTDGIGLTKLEKKTTPGWKVTGHIDDGLRSSGIVMDIDDDLSVNHSWRIEYEDLHLRDLRIDESGHIALCGDYIAGGFSSKPIAMAISGAGDILWANSYNPDPTSLDRSLAVDIFFCETAGYVVFGSILSGADGWLATSYMTDNLGTSCCSGTISPEISDIVISNVSLHPALENVSLEFSDFSVTADFVFIVHSVECD